MRTWTLQWLLWYPSSAVTWNCKSDVKKNKKRIHWLFLPTVWWRYLHTSRENCGSSDSYSVLDLCFMFKAQWLLHCMPVLSALSSKCSPQRAVTDILWIMHFYNTFLSSAVEESNIGTCNFFLLYKIALEKVCAKKNIYVNKVVFFLSSLHYFRRNVGL